MKRALLPVFAAALLATSARAAAAQDTLVVRADGAPRWGPAPRLVEELRLGVIDGDPHRTFGEVTGVVVQDDGEVWIADDEARLVRRFSRDGAFLGDVGGPGTGPGEFSTLRGLQRLKDGRVAAYDPRRKRILLFARDGAYLSTLTLPMESVSLTTFRSFVVGKDDGFYIYGSALAVPVSEVRGRTLTPAEMERAIHSIWIHVPKDRPVIDTLRVPPRDAEDPTTLRHPFAPMPAYVPTTLSAVSPLGYLVTARTDRYAIHHPLPDGRVLRIERSWVPIPVEPEEKTMVVDELRPAERRREDSPGAGNVRMAEVSLPDVPDTKPAFWALQLDQDGRMWVATHQPGTFRAETDRERSARMMLPSSEGGPGPRVEWVEPLVTDVLDAGGTYLGTVRFPSDRSAIAWASGDVLWAVERGEYDEAYVVRYRIEHG